MKNKYISIIKNNIINYVENKISLDDFIAFSSELTNDSILDSLNKDGFVGLSNLMATVEELNNKSSDSIWIIDSIYRFYASFKNDFSIIYSPTFYLYLKNGLNEKICNPIESIFKNAVKDYLDKKISCDCLAFISNEILNNFKYFESEIIGNKELNSLLNETSKIGFNRILEDLSTEEESIKNKIDSLLSNYISV